MDPMRAGRTSEEGPPSARAPGAGGRMGRRGRPRSCLRGSDWPGDRRNTGCAIAGSPTRLSVPGFPGPAMSFCGSTPRRSGALGPSSRLGSGGDSRQGEGSQVAVELWRVRAKPDSPGLGAALVRNPLELTDRVSSVCTLLCQGTAAGVE